MFGAANDYAKPGVRGPDCWTSTRPTTVPVWSTEPFLIKRGMVESRDVPAAELGLRNRTQVPAMLTAANDYAVRTGYTGAFATGANHPIAGGRPRARRICATPTPRRGLLLLGATCPCARGLTPLPNCCGTSRAPAAPDLCLELPTVPNAGSSARRSESRSHSKVIIERQTILPERGTSCQDHLWGSAPSTTLVPKKQP
jgi:hypothetical protein